MARKKETDIKTKKKDEEVKESKEKQRCSYCGKKLANSNYYKSKALIYNGNNGQMTVCKTCVNEEFLRYLKLLSEDVQNAILMTCAKFSIPYDQSFVDGAMKTITKVPDTELEEKKKTKENGFMEYMKNLNSLGLKNRSDTEFDYIKYINQIVDEQKNKTFVKAVYAKDFVPTQEMVDFWGTNVKEDLYFLENEWHNLLTRYECDSYSTEMLFQEIAHQRLEIKNKRSHNQSVNSELKTLQELLGSANIKPVQETGSNMSEQQTFGTLIKKFENERPIPEPEEEWKDVDGIMKYISIWFFGHLCKMLGVKNSFSEMYEEEMKKYRVELEDEDMEEEASEIDLSNVDEEA